MMPSRRSVTLFATASFLACAGAPQTPRLAHTTVDAGVVEETPLVIKSACGGASSTKPSRTFDRKSDDAANVCDAYNLDSAEDAILASNKSTTPATSTPWDHKTAPLRLDEVVRRFGLSAAERDRLMQQGFVVPKRLTYSDYVFALHDLYQSQMPLYVSVDAVLHAIYAGNDGLLVRLESRVLLPRLTSTLKQLYDALPAASASYPSEVVADLDVYLGVARTLLEGKPVASHAGRNAEIAELVAKVQAAGGIDTLELFGRQRKVDFSQYKPRGHYERTADPSNPWAAPDLRPYFKAAMWLSRIDFNLVTRSCASASPTGDPAQTPREATSAVALSDLATRAGAMCDIEVLDHAWGLLAGKREDVSVAELAALAPHPVLTIPATANALQVAIGNRFHRTARTGYMFEGCTELPVVSTLLGPRIVPDVSMARPLTHSETPNRQMMGGPDVAFALGHDRALAYLQSDLTQYPALARNLRVARGVASGPLSKVDLYSAWFGAVRSLSSPVDGTVPSFMHTEAFSDMRVSSTIAAFGQMRHNYVLMAAQPYSEEGCEIPDGFVEPAPAVYDGLIAYADLGSTVVAEMDAKDEAGARGYFEGLARTLRVLKAIGDDELANRPLSPDEQRFLSMVVEIAAGSHSTGGSPRFDGWYFDLFGTHEEAFGGAGFAADFFTSGETGRVAHVGVHATNLGIFVVDTGGQPRVVVGPVTESFGYTGASGERLTDAEALKLKDSDRDERWSSSYAVEAPPVPALRLKTVLTPVRGKMPSVTITAQSTHDLGDVTIELLDHHRHALRSVTHAVGTKPVTFTFVASAHTADATPYYEGLAIGVGEFRRVFTSEPDVTEGESAYLVGNGTIRLGGL
jgi:Protein of unknown function (DUF3160)